MEGQAGARRPPAALGRDHRADRPQDDDQRAQLGCGRVHGRLRGRQRPHLAQHGRRAHQPARRDRRHDHLRRLGRPPLPPRGEPRHAARPPPRLAPPRAPPAGRRGARLGLPVRLRPIRLPLRAATAREGLRPVLLPAQDGVAPGSAPLERRVQLRPGRARDRTRHDQGDGADRDAAGGVRDGRDPVRAARSLGRAERRPLGLHLLGDQVLPREPRHGPARPGRRDHDRAVHAARTRSCSRPRATSAAPTRWAGWRR